MAAGTKKGNTRITGNSAKRTNGGSGSTEASVSASPRASAKQSSGAGSAQKSSGLTRTPTQEEIAARAYQIWEQRGGVGGNAQEDWLQAERDLLAAPQSK